MAFKLTRLLLYSYFTPFIFLSSLDEASREDTTIQNGFSEGKIYLLIAIHKSFESTNFFENSRSFSFSVILVSIDIKDFKISNEQDRTNISQYNEILFEGRAEMEYLNINLSYDSSKRVLIMENFNLIKTLREENEDFKISIEHDNSKDSRWFSFENSSELFETLYLEFINCFVTAQNFDDEEEEESEKVVFYQDELAQTKFQNILANEIGIVSKIDEENNFHDDESFEFENGGKYFNFFLDETNVLIRKTSLQELSEIFPNMNILTSFPNYEINGEMDIFDEVDSLNYSFEDENLQDLIENLYLKNFNCKEEDDEENDEKDKERDRTCGKKSTMDIKVQDVFNTNDISEFEESPIELRNHETDYYESDTDLVYCDYGDYDDYDGKNCVEHARVRDKKTEIKDSNNHENSKEQKISSSKSDRVKGLILVLFFLVLLFILGLILKVILKLTITFPSSCEINNG